MNKILFIVGISLLLIPIGNQILSRSKQENIIGTFEQRIENVEEEQKEETIAQAREYNKKIFEDGRIDKATYRTQLVFDEDYAEIMGSISIPQINCKLPIRHGTDPASLSDSVGHVMESSLPVGGNNTHCVLAGHRGLPGQELFTRLDELNEGDRFCIQVGGKTLAYQVCRIQTVKPDEVNSVAIEENRDLVSLVTCTPYGLNTHRLIVTGERVSDDVQVEVLRTTNRISKWNLFPCIFAGCSLLIVLVRILRYRKKRKEGRDEQHRNTTASASARKRRKTFMFKGRKHVQRRIHIRK